MNKIKGYNDWKELASKELKDKSLNDHYWETPEGIKVKPFTPRKISKVSITKLAFRPSSIHERARATMYTNRPWTIRQYAGFSTAEESNRFYKEGLKNGVMGLSVAFDLATHRGL